MRRQSGWGARLGCAAVVLAGAGYASAADQVVAAGPRTPQEEAKAFHLPPGFEAQLVAAEPDIHKPINIAFDDKGRLWITDTVEYPFPVPDDRKTKSRDTVKILEDFAEDGHARKITTFADDLNIPIGVLPQGDSSAVIYTIPGIYQMTDTQSAGHATERKLLVGGQGHRDTHGMTGSFTQGFDGWIYAVHGFANDSDVKGTDGSSIKMSSGNTYRFKPDGSHIEYFTHGQVNPFGMCIDALGNLFSSDCETKPIALLLRGAYYSSFGKPDDGLGFAPEIVDHMYGSTAIAGLCNYAADQFPAEYHDMMLVGNVVTGKINRSNLVARGSGFHGDDRPDLLASDDAWFRPVSMKLGPDGAIYVADFYNRIIGHYEVDLHHPGRDKERGRVWRIVYKGTDAKPARAKQFDLTAASTADLVADLGDTNLTVRLLATNRLADRVGMPAVPSLKEALTKPANPWQTLHAMWALHRLGALDDAVLKAAVSDADRAVRIHAVRILADLPDLAADQRGWTIAALKDADPMVARVAVDALGRHPDPADVRPLLEARARAVDANDPFLLHTIRISLRDHLAATGPGKGVALNGWNDKETEGLADVAVGVPTPEAASFLLDRLKRGSGESRDALVKALRHIARYLPGERSDDLAEIVARRFADEPDFQLELFKGVQEGTAQRGGTIGEGTRKSAAALVHQILTAPSEGNGGWAESAPEGSRNAKPAWDVRPRLCADGVNTAPFFTSSEVEMGTLRSKPFAAPSKLTFWMAGHNGVPPTTYPAKNLLRLRAVEGDVILASSIPPRNDTAQQFEWDLSEHAGKQVYVEAVDADSATGYAWLAFGRFEPAVVRVPASAGQSLKLRTRKAIEFVGTLKLTTEIEPVRNLLVSKSADSDARVDSARALGLVAADESTAVFATVLGDPASPPTLSDAVATSLGQSHAADAANALVDAMKAAPQRLQLTLAKALASTTPGAESLLKAVADGKASARLLQDANVRERLTAAHPADLDQRVTQLTANLPQADQQVQRLIDDRVRQYDSSKASAQRGALAFQKTCAACHRIAGVGTQIGPQLDGIGIRGVARLSEDVLDPSRNVDAAFRYSTFVLASGDVIAGLPRREEGETVIVADSTGKEISINKSQIKRRVPSNLSLMPSNFGEILKPDEFNDVMAYLLSNTTK